MLSSQYNLESVNDADERTSRARCKVLPAGKDPGLPATTELISPADHRNHFKEFRAELQAAEAKDKKFQKRKTVLKKVVANITMGNDSEQKTGLFCAWRTAPCSVTAVHGCRPMSCYAIFGNQEEYVKLSLSVRNASSQYTQWSTYFSSAMDDQGLNKFSLLYHISSK